MTRPEPSTRLDLPVKISAKTKGKKKVELQPGFEFSTPHESGCHFIRWDGMAYKNKYSASGECRNFLAFDSEGIECWFSTMMVIGHPDFTDPTNRKAN